jgi:hypothetical protein
MPHRLLVTLLLAFALTSVSGAAAEEEFERIVGVGAHGAWSAISLNPTGPHSDLALLRGRPVAAPTGGYVRMYPIIGGLPAVPGRYYVSSHVLCFDRQGPVSSCSRLGEAGTKLLSPFARLPLRQLPPTAPVGVRYRSRLLRYANGNIFAALELAFERAPIAASSTRPRNSIRLGVTWRGPKATALPRTLLFAPSGVYASHRLFPLQRAPWCYLAENLPGASPSLIDAANRLCR